jgi:hypothetical protein
MTDATMVATGPLARQFGASGGRGLKGDAEERVDGVGDKVGG